MPMSSQHKANLSRAMSRVSTQIKERQRCPNCDRKGAILTRRLTYWADDGGTVTQCRFCEATITYEGYKRAGG